MKTIYKYVLFDPARPPPDLPTEDQGLLVPLVLHQGANVLSVAVQYGVVCVWALVDLSRETEKRAFRIYGTGGSCEINQRAQFLGTVLLAGGELVLHVFVDREDS